MGGEKNNGVVEAGKEQKGHFCDVVAGAAEDFDFGEDENEPGQFFGRLGRRHRQRPVIVT